MTSLREAMAAAQAKVEEVAKPKRNQLMSWREILDMGYKSKITVNPWARHGGIGSLGWNE